ncbi:MAG: hypothetical protein K2N55_00210 [Lachnospiraceae bacterium]|nr:hypothetical protein [Lachnospiraceae bacterium]
MMRGNLTVFLSLSLSLLTGFILLLTGNAIKNAVKVRYECAADTSMNAVLSEFHIALFERYGLIYIDASYLGSQPCISNMEDRLRYYIEENTTKILTGKDAPWGKINTQQVVIPCFETAAAGMGASMRNQAICYVEDTGIFGKEQQVLEQIGEIQILSQSTPMEEWSNIMEQIDGMELPCILNEEGIWEEVPLSNPADGIYHLVQSDVLFLAGINLETISPAKLSLENYISHRQVENTGSIRQAFKEEDDLFLSYLFNKMGHLGNARQSSLLSCQLEYIAEGKASDLENVRASAEELFSVRFADNTACALADGDLRAEAFAAAEELLAVSLKEELKAPVAESILYACAFLESISDVRAIYEGKSIPVRKSGHSMSVTHVLDGNFYCTGGNQGWSYEQYLAGLILLAGKEAVNLRAMDIMEMDIRLSDGNHNFKMDWCIERYEAIVTAVGDYGSCYELRRTYGYF